MLKKYNEERYKIDVEIKVLKEQVKNIDITIREQQEIKKQLTKKQNELKNVLIFSNNKDEKIWENVIKNHLNGHPPFYCGYDAKRADSKDIKAAEKIIEKKMFDLCVRLGKYSI